MTDQEFLDFVRDMSLYLTADSKRVLVDYAERLVARVQAAEDEITATNAILHAIQSKPDTTNAQ